MVYLDNAATTQVRKEVLDAMLPFLSENFGNPSSIYEVARLSKKSVEDSRELIANAIGAQPNEIFFTGSGTESDNWAIKGIASANLKKGNHIITTQIEHHAVLHTCEFLAKNGYEVTYLPVDEFGIIDLNELKKAIKPQTTLISVMFANNEIGTIQPINEIGEIAKEHGILFHTDAVQAIAHVKINVKDLNVDAMSLTAHKLYGPKGIGALYVKKGTKINQLMHGGGQENGRRAGTENVAGIVGFGAAIKLATEEMEQESKRLLALRNKLINGILSTIPNSRLNGHPEKRLCSNVNISFDFIEGESLLMLLDMKKIFASSGSACTSGSLDPSHVLLAIGLKHENAHGSLRLTLGRNSTEADVDYVIETLPPLVKRLRDMSPLCWILYKQRRKLKCTAKK